MASVYQCFRSSTCGQPISANPIFKPQDNAKLTFKTSSQLGTSQARWLSEVAPAEEDKISIGPASGRQSEEGEKETGIFYYGPISSTIKKVKLMSLSTCCLSVSLGPVMERVVKKNQFCFNFWLYTVLYPHRIQQPAGESYRQLSWGALD